MISYELALKLKEAGWTQENPEYVFDGQELEQSTLHEEVCENVSVFAAPLLEELIAACGEELQTLGRRESIDGTKYWAASKYELGSLDWEDIAPYEELKKGNSPEEAVANLWLKLNEK